MHEDSITAMSSRAWICKRPLKLMRYLRRFHKLEDRDYITRLLYNRYPDEGVKLIKNFDLDIFEKKQIFLKWIIEQPQITCGIFADQRMGKDALICKIFEDVQKYCEHYNRQTPRFVTLGNIRCPPFVNPQDMYYSFKNIPAGTKDREVWIYSSEIETVLPARGGLSSENMLFSQLEGTMAQNHQKLFGCCKLASKVDINFIRGMNVKLFKFISPDKMRIDGIERDNILSELGKWHLPKTPYDKKNALLTFDNQLFLVPYELPSWWSDNYSEQFCNVPMEKMYEYVDVMSANGLNPSNIVTAVSQKFRVNLTQKQVEEIIKEKT